MERIDEPISIDELKSMSQRIFGGLVKAVVDVKKGIMVLDAEMHADCEKYLLEQGSNQDDLWGINLYPEVTGADFVEFDSMINLRPRLKNFSRDIESPMLRKKILKIIDKLIIK